MTGLADGMCNLLDPQSVTTSMGPTELCPGTHWAPRLEPTSSPVLTVAPAGTIFITDYPIFHRRAASHEPCNRDLLKYMYWRTSLPSRDWVGSDTPFDFARADYHSPHRHAIMGDCEQVVRCVCQRSLNSVLQLPYLWLIMTSIHTALCAGTSVFVAMC